MICFMCMSKSNLIVFHIINGVKYYICMGCIRSVDYKQLKDLKVGIETGHYPADSSNSLFL